jgi:hypothetical protein
MFHYETFSAEGIKRFGKLFLGLLNTSSPNASPSPARVQITTITFRAVGNESTVLFGLGLGSLDGHVVDHPLYAVKVAHEFGSHVLSTVFPPLLI